MLAFLSKKIAIPNHTSLTNLSWNCEDDFIAVSGVDGLLKVLKLEASHSEGQKAMKGIAAPSNLSMNQSLEGHTGGTVKQLAWNNCYKRLASSDETGLIIVWTLHKGVWCEEMINNRNRSTVSDMKWSPDGKNICIIYMDGAVIVGSVDGHRLWGKELGVELKYIEWSPDSKMIIFVTLDSEIWIYDSLGTRLRSLPLNDELVNDSTIVGINWHHTSDKPSEIRNLQKSLNFCVCFDNGTVLLFRGENDSNPVLIQTNMTITCCSWNNQGDMIAVGGQQFTTLSTGASSDEKLKQNTNNPSNLIKFYENINGDYLRSMKIPGEKLVSVSWDRSGLRMALAVDSYIYFANVRPLYKWAYISNCILFSGGQNKHGTTAITFWNEKTEEKNVVQVSNLRFLIASSTTNSCDICATGVIDNMEKFQIYIRNSFGTVISSKALCFIPKFMIMTNDYIFAANDRTIYGLNFQESIATHLEHKVNVVHDAGSASARCPSQPTIRNKERMMDIESVHSSIPLPPDSFKITPDLVDNPICCICANQKYLLVAQIDGTLLRFILPYLNVEASFKTNCHAHRMTMNKSSRKIAIIDIFGILTIFDTDSTLTDVNSYTNNFNNLKSKQDVSNLVLNCKKLPVERKDVWDFKWAEDDDDTLAVVEKAKMVIIKGDIIEESESSACTGYIASFRGLEVKTVLLDELYSNLHNNSTVEHTVEDIIFTVETKTLRDMKDIVATNGLCKGFDYADNNSHNKLWNILAQLSLEQMNMELALKSFVKCEDYFGVQLVKKLMSMPDKMKTRAEIEVYLENFEAAERIYNEIDRSDLAIQLWTRCGNYNRALHLLKLNCGNNSSDREIQSAVDQIGNAYYEKGDWEKASNCFAESGNITKLVESLYRQNEMSKIIINLPDDDAILLSKAAGWFEALGMFEEAVTCYLKGDKSNDPKQAVDCLINLNRWGEALDMAEKFHFPQVEGLFMRQVSRLISQGSAEKQIQAVELYRLANRPTDAAMLIGDIAENVARKDTRPSLAKKLHVLSALEIERYRKRTTDLSSATINKNNGVGSIAQNTVHTIDTLMMGSLDSQVGSSKRALSAFVTAWRGSQAYHFYILAHSQLVSGDAYAAMITSIRLCEYEDILGGKEIYSLISIASLKCGYFETCSIALVKMETLPDLTDDERDELQQLSIKIFTSKRIVNPQQLDECYGNCLESGKPFRACILSGRCAVDDQSVYCPTCRSVMLREELDLLPQRVCVLCHSHIKI